MSTGFSVYELYKSATKCAQAYRAFASEYGNASPQFAAFRDELESSLFDASRRNLAA